MRWMCSADSHLIEPADLWTSRAPEKLRRRVPRYEFKGNTILYCVEDRVVSAAAASSMALPDGTLPPNRPSERLEWLEKDGVFAEALLGNLAGITIFSIDDPELAIVSARAYNDYLAETFGPYRARELGIGLIPILDVPAAVAEIQRSVSLGLRGITLPTLAPEPYYLEKYEPIWAAASRLGLPVSFHAHTGGRPGADRINNAAEVERTPRIQDAVKTLGAMAEANQAFDVLAALLGAGVLQRFPELHVVFVETGAGWLASAIEAIDFTWRVTPGQDRAGEGITGYDAQGRAVEVPVNAFLGGGWRHPLPPSTYVRRQVHATFQDEPAAIRFRHSIGIEPLLWGSDFPHPEGTWPRSREVVEALFAEVETAEREAILGGTFAKLYGVTVPN